MKKFISVLISWALVFLPVSIQALPLGQKVVNGNASFNTNASTMNITASNKAIINYNSFNINQNEVVNFLQPSANSVVLNRVIQANPSSIMGALNANGKVFLINPAGIVFGAHSSINTNSFLATTLDIKNSDFINGNYSFNQSQNQLPSYILQQGQITVSPEGFVVLASPLVKQDGLIFAKSGTIKIGAVDNFYLNFDQRGLVKFDYIPQDSTKTDVIISMKVAELLMQDVVNNQAVEEAINIVEKNGVISLVGGSGTALINGELNADEKGSIGVEANNYIALLDDARLSANGGGDIVIFSQKDAYSSKEAVLSAKDRGFVELSAKRRVIYDGSFVDTSSKDGEFGLFYIDPLYVTIASNVSISSDYFAEATRSIVLNENITINTNGGDILFEAPSITLEENSKLQAGTGDITLRANSVENSLIDIKNGVVISGAKIKLEASTYRTSEFDSDSDDPLLKGLEAVADFVIDMPLTPIAFKEAITTSTINIADATISGDSIAVSSKAEADVSVSALFEILALAYGKSEATSSLHVSSGATLNASGDITLKSEATTINSVSGKATNILSDTEKKKQANFALAYSKTTTTSNAIVDSGAIINAKNFKLLSIGNKDISTSATGQSLSAGTLGAAVAISDSTSNINSSLGGTINANSVEVSSVTNIEKIKTSSSAGVGNGFLYKHILESSGDKTTAVDKTKSYTDSKAPTTNAKSGVKKIALSAAFSYSKHTNNSEAKIAQNAVVNSVGDVKVKSDIIYGENGSYEDNGDITIIGDKGIKTIAIATIDSTEENPKANSFSGAVVLTDITNNSKAFIGDGASVQGDGDLQVKAKTYLGYNIDWENIKHFNSIKDIVPKVADANFRGRLFTSYAQSNAQGTQNSLSGSYNHFKLTSNTDAFIGENVNINQGGGSFGGVEVLAYNNIEALNFAGVIGWTYFGTKAGSAAVGGSYLDVDYLNNTKAYVKTGTKIKATDLRVAAIKEANNLSISTAGGSGQYAISGSFSALKTVDNTYAYIDGATVVISDGINDKYYNNELDTNLRVNAQNKTEFSNRTGGIIKGNNVGVGVSGSLNDIQRDTQAYINNSTISRTSNQLLGLHYIKAYNSGFINAFAISGSIISPKPPVSTNGQTTSIAGGKFGFTFSGDASVNNIDDDANAYIKDSIFTLGLQKVKLLAKNNSDIGSYAGSGAFNFSKKSAGLAGSYAGNYFNNDVNSYIKDSSLHVKSIEMKSQNSGEISTLSGSGSIGTGIAALAGSVSINDIQNDTTSYVDNSNIALSEDLELNSIDDTAIKSLAGSVALNKSLGVGLSYAKNKIQNNTTSYIKNSSLDTKDISLFSNQKNSIKNISATASGALTGTALAGAISINEINNLLDSYITNIAGAKSIVSSGDISLKSLDESNIESITGSVGASKVLGVGVSTLHNKITNNVNAYLADVSNISSKNLSIKAISDKVIVATSVGGAGAGTVAIAGSTLINKIEDDLDAFIHDSNVIASDSLLVHAIEQNNLTTYGGTASGAGTVGIGGTVVVNTLNSRISSRIKNSVVDVKGDGSLKVPVLDASTYSEEEDLYGISLLSLANENITAYTANASGAGTVAFTASANFNTISDRLYSYIYQSDVNLNEVNPNAHQSVVIRALTNNNISTNAGGLAGAGTVGIGGSLNASYIKNKTSAYIKSSSVKAQNLVEVRARGLERVASNVISGAGAGTVALAGSVSIIDIQNDNEAKIEKSVVSSKNDLKVLSKEHTYLDVKAGTKVGAGVAGVGGSVIINSVENSSIAHVDDSSVNAKDQMDIYSYNAAYLTNSASTGAIGIFGGSGTTIINSTDLTTKAYTYHEAGESVSVNQDSDYIGTNQRVIVKAADYVKVEDKLGAFGLGLVGVGGSVDITTMKNDTRAYLGQDTKLFAKKDLDIEARSKKNYSVDSLAFAGGKLGVAGSVVIANIGSNMKQDALNAQKNTKNIINKMVDSASNARLGSSSMGSGANSDISAQNDRISFSDQFSTTPTIDNITKALIASNSVVNVGNHINIDANNLITKLAIQSGGGAGGLIGVGGAVALAYVGADNIAYISDDVTIDAKDLSLRAKYDIDDISIKSYAGSIGAVGLGATYTRFLHYYTNRAEIRNDAFIVSTNSASIDADTKEDIFARGYGANFGAAAAGSSSVDVYDEGETSTLVGERSRISARDGGIEMLTSYTTDIDARTWAAAGGAISTTGSSSDIKIEPTLSTTIEDNAIFVTTGDVNIKTLLYDNLLSRAEGYGLGGIFVGRSYAQAYNKAYIDSIVGNDVLINANDFYMLTYENRDAITGAKIEDNSIEAYAKSSVGTLIGGNGAHATTSNHSYLNASIGTDSLVNTKDDITIKTKSYAKTLSKSEGKAYGLVSFGSTRAYTHNDGETKFELNDGSKLIANDDVLINSYAKKNAYVTSYGGAGGLISGAGTRADADIGNIVKIAIDDNTKIIANYGDVNLLATGNIYTSVDSSTHSYGAITSSSVLSNIDIDKQDIQIYIKNSKIVGNEVNLISKVEYLYAKSEAFSKTYAAGSYSRSYAYLTLRSNVGVTISGATVIGYDAINIKARQPIEDVFTFTKAKTTIGPSVIGVLRATVENNPTFKSQITIMNSAKLQSDNRDFDIVVPDWGSNWIKGAQHYGKSAIVENHSISYWVEKKVWSWISGLWKWVTKKTLKKKWSQSYESSKGKFTKNLYIAFSQTTTYISSPTDAKILSFRNEVKTQQNNDFNSWAPTSISGELNEPRIPRLFSPIPGSGDETNGLLQGASPLSGEDGEELFEEIDIDNYETIVEGSTIIGNYLPSYREMIAMTKDEQFVLIDNKILGGRFLERYIKMMMFDVIRNNSTVKDKPKKVLNKKELIAQL